MAANRRIGITIVVTCALAADGMISGYLSREIAVGIAVIGMIIGKAVLRGRFSGTDVIKRS